MDRIGLIKNTIYSKTGHVKDFNLVNQEKFIKTPFKYLMEEVVPFLCCPRRYGVLPRRDVCFWWVPFGILVLPLSGWGA
ncbi:hypothetical protein SGGMMB4_04374 [Sodalis glossinidius str. 'morsitans']|uniref:Uncharacterized protein n=1 Tax=Sodalis glossinidius (strain morsitans) TaxID=343509 RepID=A0A193QLM7_SODGM|nr:hypothetical protein [Sodalis glossinidius]CRL46076.1 hypothetical protein SGGMMB4_04374 [Sodalis glossinidius str. 'morsitans']